MLEILQEGRFSKGLWSNFSLPKALEEDLFLNNLKDVIFFNILKKN